MAENTGGGIGSWFMDLFGQKQGGTAFDNDIKKLVTQLYNVRPVWDPKTRKWTFPTGVTQRASMLLPYYQLMAQQERLKQAGKGKSFGEGAMDYLLPNIGKAFLEKAGGWPGITDKVVDFVKGIGQPGGFMGYTPSGDYGPVHEASPEDMFGLQGQEAVPGMPALPGINELPDLSGLTSDQISDWAANVDTSQLPSAGLSGEGDWDFSDVDFSNIFPDAGFSVDELYDPSMWEGVLY